MKKHIQRFAAFLVSAISIVACVAPMGNGGTQPSSDQVETLVAMTLQAMAPESTDTPANVFDANASLLPRSLYFLGTGDQASIQVIRMERDGKTQTQLTFEPVSVDDYDVSPADGSIAYVANNQLLLANADGSNRRVLLDGGPRDGKNPWLTAPVFSPDGKTLAYGHNGLNLYDLGTSTSNLVIQDQVKIADDGTIFPVELYSPVRYSPDGTKLLLALGHWESLPTHSVYHLGTNTLIGIEAVTDYIYCCSFHGGPVWASDSASFFGVASVHDSAYQFGELWRVDAGNGGLTRSFKSPLADDTDGSVYLPVEPYLAPDGQLYFFFGTYAIDSGFYDAPTIEMVRSAPDGVTSRTVLREENFALMDEALWAPDASFVIVATFPERRWDQGGGVLELYPTDGQKDEIWLAPFGKQMKWGP